MKHFLLLPIVLLAALTGCSSIVGAIIGERKVENLFGLDGREVIFSLPEGFGLREASGEIFPAQDLGGFINVELGEIPFNDLSELNFPLGAIPKAASEELGIQGKLTVTSASASETAFPSRLGLANPELDLTLTDGFGAPSVRQQLQSTGDVSVTFNKTTCQSTEAGTVCTYQAAESEYYFFTLALEGQDFETLFNDILQAGTSPNKASGVVTLSVSTSVENLPPVPLDSSFKLVLETRDGKIRFF